MFDYKYEYTHLWVTKGRPSSSSDTIPKMVIEQLNKGYALIHQIDCGETLLLIFSRLDNNTQLVKE